MIFPELVNLVKAQLSRFLGDDGRSPISLNLNSEKKEFNTKDAYEWYMANGYNKIAGNIIGGLPSWSGQIITREVALQQSTIYACNKIICEPIGYIPASLMRRVGNEKIYAEDHPMFEAMRYQPNEEMTSQTFREMLTSHCLLSGGAFAQIIRRSGPSATAIYLQHLLPEQVNIDREKTGQRRLVYDVSITGNSPKPYVVEPGKPHDILHIRGLGWDGVRGYDVITIGKQSIGTVVAGEQNIGRFWANGGRVPFVLENEKRFADDPSYEKFRNDVRVMASRPHEPFILEIGTKYKQIGLSMVDAQANEFRQFSIPEMCRWFSVSPHLVHDLSRATFSNIEHLTLEFVKMTLSTWITRWELDFRRCVLTPAERAQGYFLKHNVNALLRGDFKTRMDGYSIMLQNGIANVDEIRDLEDWNALPDGAGKTYRFQLNMQTTPGTGEPTIVEQGIVNRPKKSPDATASGKTGE